MTNQNSSTIPFRFVTLYRQNLSIGRTCKFHSHNAFELVFHPSGEGMMLTRDGRKYEFTPNSLIICPPGLQHAQTMTAPGADYCLLANAAGDIPKVLKDEVSVLHNVKDSYILREIYALTDLSSTYNEGNVLDLRISALFAAVAEEMRKSTIFKEMKSNAWYAAEARRLAEEVSNNRDVAAIAKRLNISPDYLRHVFKEQFGFTLKSCIGSLRIKRADELLTLSNMPYKMIADQCGYSNERYFCTAYKRAKGMTPGQFRNIAHKTSCQ